MLNLEYFHSVPFGRFYSVRLFFGKSYLLHGVQRSGKPGNVRGFRCKEKKSGKSWVIFKKQEKSGNFV